MLTEGDVVADKKPIKQKRKKRSKKNKALRGMTVGKLGRKR